VIVTAVYVIPENVREAKYMMITIQSGILQDRLFQF